MAMALSQPADTQSNDDTPNHVSPQIQALLLDLHRNEMQIVHLDFHRAILTTMAMAAEINPDAKRLWPPNTMVILREGHPRG